MSLTMAVPSQASRPSRESAQTMWRTLAALFFAGGTIGAVSLLLPHPPGLNTTALWSNIAIAFAGSALCLLVAGRLGVPTIQVAILIGTLLVTRAVYYSSDPSGFYAFFYVWIGLFAGFFFTRRAALVQVAAVGVCYAWVLHHGGQPGGVADWMMAVFTIAVGGLMLDVLARRERKLTDGFEALAAERAELMERLELVARTDELTGLTNRRAWDEAMVRELARAGRDGTELCVALVDLDHFKRYNDELGHQAGDRLLKSVAAVWRDILRAGDVLARYGGEEFALALPGCSLDDASALVTRLREAVPQAQTCSAGIAVWDGEEDGETLLGRADAAMYAAKQAGRNRVTVV
jgi:diguanylate cyclase (GGDEF)-like protein